MTKIVPIHELEAPHAISSMYEESSGPIYANENGYDDMVIMRMKTYDKYMLRQEIYQNLAAA